MSFRIRAPCLSPDLPVRPLQFAGEVAVAQERGRDEPLAHRLPQLAQPTYIRGKLNRARTRSPAGSVRALGALVPLETLAVESSAELDWVVRGAFGTPFIYSDAGA